MAVMLNTYTDRDDEMQIFGHPCPNDTFCWFLKWKEGKITSAEKYEKKNTIFLHWYDTITA